MDNMQVQGKPMAQEDQVEREEIEKAQEAGVIDFNKKEDPGKSLNYTHKFAETHGDHGAEIRKSHFLL